MRPAAGEHVADAVSCRARAGPSSVDRPADGRLGRAEGSYRAGRVAEEARDGDRAAGLYFDAAADAFRVLCDPGPAGAGASTGPRAADATALYNTALARFLRLTAGRAIRPGEPWRDALAARGVRAVRRDADVWDPDEFDALKFAADFAVRGLEHEHRVDGLGVPLIAVRRADLKDLERRRGPEKFLMPRQVYPVTAVLRVNRTRDDPPGSGPEAVLELHDPLRSRRLALAPGRAVPLAADLSTPLAYHLARSPLPVLEQVGLLQPQWLEKLAGLYMLHPYEPGKIPVVLIHGVWSSPRAWLQMINDLRGDPELRDRYQFWLFMYPTGNPVTVSAATLRQALAEVRETLDPRGTDPALGEMVLVGHSMGGLLAKMMAQDSGEELWKLVATRPFAEVRATPEQREMLERLFFFGPQPSVRRVVFIATPHRGSDLGNEFLGRFVDRLIRLPNPLRATYKALLTLNGPDFFTPTIRAGLPSSVDNLSRESPLLVTLGRLPLRPDVPYHSILGQKEPGPVESGSDGVVPYASAHLDGAASEVVVPDDHTAQDHPEAIREVGRILRVHLARMDRERAAPAGPAFRPLGESAPYPHPGAVTRADGGRQDPSPTR
jgi:pimeloyl-ACP methyl ester carboxylesterase